MALPARMTGPSTFQRIAILLTISSLLFGVGLAFAQTDTSGDTLSGKAEIDTTVSATSGMADADTSDPNSVTAQSESGVFNNSRWNAIVLIVFFSIAILFYTRRAQRGQELYVRKIPGLEAVEEAVGRATEMGRVVIFIPGIQELDEIQTIAGVTILGRVARITAEYDTPLLVPVRYPLVYAGSQEMVEQSYVEVGRKDSFNQDIVRYVAGEQFAFTAHVNGLMVREKPAAVIYMGAFFAESLLLAETGFAAGAIQIAGTAEVAQLPFFITACDYTLIGEELFAATAYLSRNPLQLGGLKGQDITKALIIIFLVLGSFATYFFADSLGEWFINAWSIAE